jgi:hypothetical protein
MENLVNRLQALDAEMVQLREPYTDTPMPDDVAGQFDAKLAEFAAREEFDEVNAKVMAENGRPAKAKPVLQGITKASLHTRSFISAATSGS